MGDIERTDEWTTMQAALAFGGFMDADETERVTLWAAEEIESLRRQLRGAAEDNANLRDALCLLRGYVDIDSEGWQLINDALASRPAGGQ